MKVLREPAAPSTPNARHKSQHSANPIDVREPYAPILVILLAFGCYTFKLTDNLFPGGDNARYLILAESLITGNGYRNMGTLAAPYHTLAPPGFPLILAAVISVFGLNITVAKICIATLAALSVALVYTFFRRKHGSGHALGIAALYSVTPVVFMYARRIYSDLPFLVISLVALMSIARYAAKKSQINAALATSLLSLVAGFYLRPVALTLVLAAGLWLLLKKMPAKAFLLCIPTVTLIVPWYFWVNSVGATKAPGHLPAFLTKHSLPTLTRMALANGVQYARLTAENLWYLPTKGLEHLGLSVTFTAIARGCVVLAALLVLTGFIHYVRRKPGLADLYVAIYTTMLLLYGFVLDRFIIAVTPFIIHYFIRGILVCVAWIGQHGHSFVAVWLKRSLIALVIVSSSAHIAARVYQEQNFARFSPNAAAHYDIARWAAGNLEKTAVVATDHPDFFYVYAGQRTVDLREGHLSLSDSDAIRFVVADDTQIAAIRQQIQRREAHYGLMSLYCAGESGTCLYEIVWAIEKGQS